MISTQESPQPPAHVPADRIRDCPLLRRGTTSANPFGPMVDEIHQGPAVFWSADAYPGGGAAWVLRRFEDVRRVYLDTTNFSNHGLTPFSALIGERWVEVPVELDPPLHTKFRAWLNPLFTPRKIAELEGRMREVARGAVATIAGRSGCDFMADFAFPFPVTIFLDLIGLPQNEMPRFLTWERALLHGTNMQQVAATVREVKAYMLGVIEERRARPAGDFISLGVHAEVDGRPLSEDELIGYCFNLFVGGLDTVSSALGLLFRHIAESPADQQLLRDEPGRIPAAVEELLRAYSPASTFRTCVNDVEIDGVTIKRGDKVAMSPAIANRDPEVFANPGKVDFDRRGPQLAFAFGPHICLGVHLARLELRIAIEEFLNGVPPFGVAPRATIETLLGGVVQPTALPLAWQRG